VGGLDIAIRIRSVPTAAPSLPQYIPRVQPRAGFQGAKWPAFAVPIDRVGTEPPLLTAKTMKAKMRISDDAKIVLLTHQHDHILESLWKYRYRLTEELRQAEFDLVLVPSFSTWDTRTRLEHRYQIARSLRFLELLVESRIPTLPNVSWYLEVDILEWARELRSWPGPRAFSIDLQTLQTDEKWDWGIASLRKLSDALEGHWAVIANGVGRTDKIRDLQLIFAHIHIINARPFELAMANRMATGDWLVSEVRTDPAARMDAFRTNLGRWAAVVPSCTLCGSRGSTSENLQEKSV